MKNLHEIFSKYIKSLLMHPLNSSHTQLLKHAKHRPTDIDIAEENNIYRMLTQQRSMPNWENHGFGALASRILYSKFPEIYQL